MGGRSVDALQSFAYLSENLPSWIDRVSNLASYTAAKHAEFSAEYKKLTHVKPRRRKNSSVYSIRPDDMHPSEQKGNPQKGEAVESVRREGEVLDSTSKDTPVGNTRKRRTDEAPSVRSDDGPQIIRTRHMVVVHYDGHAQKEMEQVVRDIGSARNNIRRGKMTHMMKPGFALGMFSKMSDASAAALGRIDAADTAPQLAEVVSPRTRNVRKESPFDFADKQLELAQSLCESGAHQFLRCGDCSNELAAVQEKFRILSEMANAEVERLNEEKKSQEENETEPDSHPEPVKEKPAGVIAAVAENCKPPEPGPTAIEVDDGVSTDSVSIDMTAFRSANRFRV